MRVCVCLCVCVCVCVRERERERPPACDVFWSCRCSARPAGMAGALGATTTSARLVDPEVPAPACLSMSMLACVFVRGSAWGSSDAVLATRHVLLTMRSCIRWTRGLSSRRLAQAWQQFHGGSARAQGRPQRGLDGQVHIRQDSLDCSPVHDGTPCAFCDLGLAAPLEEATTKRAARHMFSSPPARDGSLNGCQHQAKRALS